MKHVGDRIRTKRIKSDFSRAQWSCPFQALQGRNLSLLRQAWASPGAQMAESPPAVQGTWVGSLGWEDPLEKGMATRSSILAWRIPWTEEPGGLSRGVTESQIEQMTVQKTLEVTAPWQDVNLKLGKLNAAPLTVGGKFNGPACSGKPAVAPTDG